MLEAKTMFTFAFLLLSVAIFLFISIIYHNRKIYDKLDEQQKADEDMKESVYSFRNSMTRVEATIDKMYSIIDFKRLKGELDSFDENLVSITSSNNQLLTEYKQVSKKFEQTEKYLKDLTLIKKRMLSVDELIEYTGYSNSHIRKLVRDSEIPYSRPKNLKKIFFDKEKIDKWLLLDQVGDWSFLDDEKNIFLSKIEKRKKLESEGAKILLDFSKIGKLEL